MEMIPKECLPPCNLQCNRAPELELECESCPHRNKAKPMPGGGERPRWRLVTRILGNITYHQFHDQEDDCDEMIADCYWAAKGTKNTAWIQFERNGIS